MKEGIIRTNGIRTGKKGETEMQGSTASRVALAHKYLGMKSRK
jgi:hypothetical protein